MDSKYCVLCQTEHAHKRGLLSRDRMARATAKVTGVSIEALLGTNRSKHISRARQLGMMAVLEAGYSTPEAAKTFGRHDHTTALHARKQIRKIWNEEIELMILDIRRAYHSDA
jgi:chromosomal replication initiation ATPase DnaA